MKKTQVISAILTGVSIFALTPAVSAVELTESSAGNTKLEILDYTIDPDTELPGLPGAFSLVEVPSIDFGQHSLEDIADQNISFNGITDKDLKVRDTRASQLSIEEALAQIDKVEAENDGSIPQEEIDAIREAWENTIPASAWKISAKATQLDEIGTSLSVQYGMRAVEILNTPGIIVEEKSDAPIGTKTYPMELASLFVANNNLEIKEYNGTITYTALAAE